MARNKKKSKGKGAASSVSEDKRVDGAGGDGGGSDGDELRALTRDETEARLGSLAGWELDKRDNRLVRDFAFDDFGGALAFVNKVGALAEELDHHPEIYNSYNQVSLALMTHDVDGISDRDFELAERIDALR